MPAVARRGSQGIDRVAAGLAKAPVITTIGFPLAAAALLWILNDRAWFLGDFILRLGSVERGEPFERLFPQSFPLDRRLHGDLPELLFPVRTASTMDLFQRSVGWIDAVLLAALTVHFVRALGLRGAVAAATGAVMYFGGFLTVLTGFGKSAGELCVVAAAVGVFGLTTVRENRGLLSLHSSVAAGLALHRSAVLFLPALAVIGVLWWRTHGRSGAWRSWRPWAGAVLLLATMARLAPGFVTTLRTFDLERHLAADVRAGPDPLAAAFAPLHLLDVANLIVALSPLAVLIPLLVVPRNRRPVREVLPLAVISVSFLIAMLFVHPQQGVFRDWDVFAPGGVALSMTAAWLVAGALAERRERAWLAAPILLAALVPTLQWLVHHHDVDRGLARARAIAAGPPARDATTRSQVWDYVGLRTFRLERWTDAEEAFRLSVAAVPHPRVLHEWGLAATLAEDYLEAQRAYEQIVARDPNDAVAWLGLAGASLRVGDSTATARALDQVRGFADEPRALDAMERLLREYPQIWPEPLTGLSRR